MFPVIFTSILTPVVLFRKPTKLNVIHILLFLNMWKQEEDHYVTQLLYFLFLMVIEKDIKTLFWTTPSIKKLLNIVNTQIGGNGRLDSQTYTSKV